MLLYVASRAFATVAANVIAVDNVRLGVGDIAFSDVAMEDVSIDDVAVCIVGLLLWLWLRVLLLL